MTSDEINDDIKDDNDLNTRLANRPSPNEVGIDTDIAPRIQGARNDLEYNMTKDKVSKGLKQRGTAQEAGVDTSIAPAIQGAKNDLEYNIKKDKVSKGLKYRGTAEQAGVDTSVAPAIAGPKNDLEYNMKKINVNKGIHIIYYCVYSNIIYCVILYIYENISRITKQRNCGTGWS